MKITIDLSDEDVTFLSKWASVSRTLTSARTACEAYLESLDDPSGAAHDRVDLCIDELERLEPRLNRLHMTVRNAIWEQQQRQEQPK